MFAVGRFFYLVLFELFGAPWALCVRVRCADFDWWLCILCLFALYVLLICMRMDGIDDRITSHSPMTSACVTWNCFSFPSDVAHRRCCPPPHLRSSTKRVGLSCYQFAWASVNFWFGNINGKTSTNVVLYTLAIRSFFKSRLACISVWSSFACIASWSFVSFGSFVCFTLLLTSRIFPLRCGFFVDASAPQWDPDNFRLLQDGLRHLACGLWLFPRLFEL